MNGLTRLFASFLEDLGAYDDFAYNLWKERRISVASLLEDNLPHHWVGGAFIYPQDEEDYWYIIERKWREELEDYLKLRSKDERESG